MKLKEQMFELIREWQESKLFKKDFLADKNISIAKFDYWLKKHQSITKEHNSSAHQFTQPDFTAITLPQVSDEVKLTKIIELKTASGIELTIFEKC
jgi:predicted acetyltransferase